MQNIKETEFDIAWLVCFYLGDSAAVDVQMKKLSVININFGKDTHPFIKSHCVTGVYFILVQYGMFSFVGRINCGRNQQLCDKMGINRYPIWGVLKPGGAFELHHGKNTNNDIIKFVRISAKATNVWALTAEETLSILQRKDGNLSVFTFSTVAFSLR